MATLDIDAHYLDRKASRGGLPAPRPTTYTLSINLPMDRCDVCPLIAPYIAHDGVRYCCHITNLQILHPQFRLVDCPLKRKGGDPLLSSAKHDWRTPKRLFDALNAHMNFDLDPCAPKDNNLGLPNHFTAEDDGLKQSWDYCRVFCNPPYGRELPKWVNKAFHRGPQCTVLLIPYRPDTRIWQESLLVDARVSVYALRGRLKFELADGSTTGPATFPSALVLIDHRGGNTSRFISACNEAMLGVFVK